VLHATLTASNCESLQAISGNRCATVQPQHALSYLVFSFRGLFCLSLNDPCPPLFGGGLIEIHSAAVWRSTQVLTQNQETTCGRTLVRQRGEAVIARPLPLSRFLRGPK
jgi:hypothetical protein